jgi:hypothetical protein
MKAFRWRFAIVVTYVAAAFGCTEQHNRNGVASERGPFGESYYLKRSDAFNRFVKSHESKTDRERSELVVTESDGIGHVVAFHRKGRFHFVVYRGIPIGDTEEIVFCRESEPVQNLLGDYLTIGQEVYAAAELGKGWYYIRYNDK